MAILDKMTDANRKEMLAGLFLSKFNRHWDACATLLSFN